MIVVQFQLSAALDVTIDLKSSLAEPGKSVTISVIRQALHRWIDTLTTEQLRNYTQITKSAMLADIAEPPGE